MYAKMLVRQQPVQFQLSPCSKSLVMWNSTKIKPAGTCALPVVNSRNNMKCKVSFLVVQENLTPLLSLNVTERLVC